MPKKNDNQKKRGTGSRRGKGPKMTGKKHSRKNQDRQKREAQGTLTVARGGFGFVMIEGEDEDAFVPQYRLNGAVAGDTVKVALIAGKKGRGPEGTIIDVIKRGRTHLVGTIEKRPGGFELATLESMGDRAIIIASGALKGAIEGDLVYVHIKDWGDKSSPIKGQVSEVLGRADDPRTDYDMVLRQNDLTEEFSNEIENEVATFARSVDIRPNRRREDLRHLDVITIDPASAKDFDDAISLEKLDNDKWRMGVHIADVSTYVTPGTLVDNEAFARGNSVYFNEGVVPMLPHQLSSDLCSLRPDVDRPALSAMITLTGGGKVTDVRMTQSVIHSKRRFTYEEVHETLKAGEGERYKQLRDIKRLTDAIYKQRLGLGSVDFDIPIPLFDLDKHGVPHNIRPSERLDSHRMVEECMLLANRLVAEHVPEAKPRLPFLYRVHDKPGKEKMSDLGELLRKLDLPGLPRGEVTSAMVRDLLLAMEDSPYEDLIENLTLRSMAKAEYSSENVGHFGLAFEMYTHFTSPIRRYADLVVHRMIAKRLGEPDSPKTMKVKRLQKIATQCTAREISSVRAERAYRRLKELRYLATQIDKEFEGIISGVTAKGLFVQIREILVDGFVPIERMDDDQYTYDDSLYALRGRKHRRQYQMGQQVNIRVHDVSVEGHRADFVLVD